MPPRRGGRPRGSAWICCASLVALVTLAGCNSDDQDRAVVRGSVTFNGEPVKDGVIAFIPIDGVEGPSSGGAIVDGKFEIPAATGTVLGPHRVEITAMRPVGGAQLISGVAGATTGPSGPSQSQNLEMYIPAKYNTKSQLKTNILSDVNDLPTFELKP